MTKPRILAIAALAFMLASCTEETKCTNLQTGAKGTALLGICLGGSCPANPAPVAVEYVGADGFATQADYDPAKWKCTKALALASDALLDRQGKEGV